MIDWVALAGFLVFLSARNLAKAFRETRVFYDNKKSSQPERMADTEKENQTCIAAAGST